MDKELEKALTLKTDRELQEIIAYNAVRHSVHLRRISNNLVFFFWLVVISLFFYIIGAVWFAGTTTFSG